MSLFANVSQSCLPEVDYIVVDLECHGLEAAISDVPDVYFAVTISVTGTSKPRLQVWHNIEELVSVLNTQCAFGTSLVYHNAKFDHNVLLLRGLSVPWSQVLCTQVLAYLRNNQAPSFSLDALTGKKQDLLPFAQEEGFASLTDFWNTNHSSNEGVLKRLEDYCKADTKACHGLYENLVKDLSSCPSVVNAYFHLEQPMLPILSQLERTGVQIDKPLLLASVDSFAVEVEELTVKIATLVGRLPKLQWVNDEFVPFTKWYGKASLKTPADDLPVYTNKLHVPPFYVDAEGVAVQNWSGHKLGLVPQVVGSHCPLVPFNANAATGHVYWVIKNTCPEALEDIGKTKTGKPQVNKDFVADVADLLPEDFPIGTLAKVVKKQQMALGILKHLSEDGRLRAQFNHTRTLTGRLATSNP
jgi:DNA polymerase I-like protein with 3'-5' exonuclease and polymerase domains